MKSQPGVGLVVAVRTLVIKKRDSESCVRTIIRALNVSVP